MKNLVDNTYNFLISGRQRVLSTFKIMYLLMTTCSVIVLIFSRLSEKVMFFFFSIGSAFGKGALIIFIATLLPGIGERLGIKNRFLAIVKIYRREIGICMYLLALIHVVSSKVIIISTSSDLLPQAPFEFMGMAAFFILFFLFITSNSISLIRLRIHWYRIQRLAYVGMCFIFLHVAFLELGIWSIMMGLLLILQLLSFIVVYKKTGSFTGGKPI